jgi:N-acyl-D-amino-acid deacylase
MPIREETRRPRGVRLLAATLIVNARLLDGTGAPARDAAVRIDGGRIAAVGALKPSPGETVIDASGLALAPGFIDTHSHAGGGIFDHPDALAAVSQGITTVVVGQDGESYFPLEEFFAKLTRLPAAVNVASYAGHGTIRQEVMGDDFRRAATRGEMRRMRRLLDQEMKAGALGLATGLEYDPGIYSDPDEVVALARVAAARGGRYISHVRSEDRRFWQAIEEIITIGREARLPVQISHTKLAMRSLWGQAGRLLDRLEAARAEGIDVTGDIYPYLYWQSTLTVLFPARDFEDLAEAELVVREIAPAEGLLLTQFDPEPEYAGKTLAEIARLRGDDAPKTLIELIRMAEERRKTKGDAGESVIGTSMTEEDLERLLAWPHMNLCTDGGLNGEHPRGFGSYPRVLGRYVRERRVVPLEEAIRKMTSLAAVHMGLAGRGEVRQGLAADLVLFDPAKVKDRATTREPHALSEGIRTVWVGGEVVYDEGRPTGRRPGVVLRASGRKGG